MWMISGANGYTLHPRSRFLHPMGAGQSVSRDFEALVIHDGRVVAIGDTADLRIQFGTRLSRIIDVQGATVIPGLIDSHLHVAALGEQAAQLDLSGAQSARELLIRVREFAHRVSDDGWILGRGWDDNRFTEKGLPTLEELDEASGGKPMLLRRVCHHAYLANSAAFRRADLSLNSVDPADGYYGRNEHGQLNGQVFENASRPLLLAIPEKTQAEWMHAVRIGMETALKNGLTGVHTDDVRSLGSFEAVWQTYSSLIHQAGVHLRVHELVDFGSIDESLRFLRALPEDAGEDAWLSRGAAKLFSDGAMGSRTAWLQEPYSDLPEWTGTAIYEPDALYERVRIAHEKGFGAAIHAIGDAAVDVTLRAMAAAPKVQQRDRLIHAELIRPDLISRMVNLGKSLAVDIQPRFTVSDFPWLAERVGGTRVKYACAWRQLQSAGVYIAGGSDAPIEPVAPLLGIHAALTRRLPYSQGEGYQPQECLSALDSVLLFTSGAAFAAGQEDRFGMIAPGREADLTILSNDIVNPTHPDDILQAEVLYTIVDGEIAHAFPGGVKEESTG